MGTIEVCNLCLESGASGTGTATENACCATGSCCGGTFTNESAVNAGEVAEWRAVGGLCENSNGDFSCCANGAPSDCCGAFCCSPGSCGDDMTCCAATGV